MQRELLAKLHVYFVECNGTPLPKDAKKKWWNGVTLQEEVVELRFGQFCHKLPLQVFDVADQCHFYKILILVKALCFL